MKTLTAVLCLLAAGCATSPWAKDAGCTEVVPAEPGFSGWKVMECRHPFAVLNGRDHGCQYSTREHADAKGPLLPCGWVRAYTDRAARTIYFWDLYPEALAHERQHLAYSIAEDR